MLYPLHNLHLNVLMAQGRSDLLLRVEFIKKIFIVLTIGCTFRFGVSAIVWGMLVSSVSCLVLNGYYTRKILNYRWREQVLDLAPVIGATTVMAMVMSALLFLKSKSMGAWFLPLGLTNPLTLLLVQMVVGFAIYGLIVGFSRMSAFVELRTEILFYLGHGSGKHTEGIV